MKRRSIIAVAGAVTGVLIAGSVASVAVINAASSGTASDQTPIVAASVAASDSTSDSVEPAPMPTISQDPLPAIEVPEPVVIAESPEGDPSVSSDESTAEAPESTAKSTPQETPRTISASAARQAATSATSGTVLNTSRVERGGYDAFAVQIQRPDGSVVTGYVDSATGVVFDWVMDKAAPTPTATYDDDDENYDDDDEYYDDDDDEYEDDDDEYEDDDDDDDDRDDDDD